MNPSFTPQEVINHTNAFRQENGLPPLRINKTLMSAAQERAKDMVKTGAFSHTVATTTGATFGTFAKNAGYNYDYLGENLARDFNDATSTVEGWKNSPLHKLNLLHSQYTDVGVSIVPGMKDGRPTYYVVQFFGKQQKATPATSTPKVTSKATSTPSTPTPSAEPPKERMRTRTVPMP